MDTNMRILSAVLGCLALGCSGKGAATDLNVLLITLDTTRADRLSCNGYAKMTTPVIDSIAAEGARFERAVSTAGITPMSHASILSGLNNYRHGMRVFYSEEVTHRLKDEVETLPELLGARGWTTGATVSAYPVSEAYGLNQGFDFFDCVNTEELNLMHQQRHEALWEDSRSSNTQRRGDATVDRALGWLDEVGEDDSPWCLWVHLFDAHDFSLIPPAAFTDELGLALPTKANSSNVEAREYMYDPEITFMDRQIGRLVEWLKAKGQWDRTIIVITADHGQGLRDGQERHGWFKHRLLYEWAIHVPLIIRVPGEPAGIEVANQVRTIDIVPTVLEALDLGGPPMDGQSLMMLLRGAQEEQPRLAYADALNLYDAHSPRKLPGDNYDNLYCVTDGRWKLIYHERAPQTSELFDLENDPGELVNVAAGHPRIVQRLKDFIDERQAMKVEAPSDEERAAAPDASTLQALGYTAGSEDEDEETGDGQDAADSGD